MILEPTAVSTRKLYEALVSIVTPRPIAWVSTISRDGITNLAPYSFFNAIGSNPPTVMFCPALRADGTPKDSHANVLATGEFVVNIVTENFFDAMKKSSEEFASDVDEFEMTGLAKEASCVVGPPRVAGVIAALECVLHTSMQLGTGPGGANLIIGRIVSIHLDPSAVDENGQPDANRIATIGRMGGKGYTRTADRFE